MGTRRKPCSEVDGKLNMIESLTWKLQLLVFIYLRITVSHLFVCLSILELTTFEQQVYSTKIGYVNALSLGKNSCKERNVATLNSAAHIKQKRAVYIASSESCQPKRIVRCWNKVKRKYIQGTTTKSIPLLQPEHEHGFCQQNGSERGQVQDWYPNEKIVVVPVCLNGRCCFSWSVGIVLY